MPSVVTFWWLPPDEDEFLEYLSGTGEVVALPADCVKSKALLVPKPYKSYIHEHGPTQLLLALQEHVVDCKIDVLSQGQDGVYNISDLESPVLAYQRGELQDRRLGQSNISAYWSFPSQDAAAMIPKHHTFVKWGKKVLSWIRRSTDDKVECNGFSYRSSRRAKQAVVQGKLHAVLY